MDKIQELIDYRTKVKISKTKIKDLVGLFIIDLQQLQAEPKQEADIDAIIREYFDRKEVPISLEDNLRKAITKHLTQKTTVPKDGEVVEISKKVSERLDCACGEQEDYMGAWKCLCGKLMDGQYNYCQHCGVKIKRID